MDHLHNPEAPERKPSPSLGYLAVSRGTHLPSIYAINAMNMCIGLPENGLQDDSSHQISNGIHENLHTPVAVPPSQSPLTMITQGENWVQANGFTRKHLQSGASNFQVVKKRREGETPCQNGDHSFRAYPAVSCLRASCPTPPLSPRHMPPPQQVLQAVQMQGMTSFQGILGSDLGYGQLQSGNLVQSQAGPHLGLGPAQNYMQREPPEARRAALREWGNRPLSMVDPDLWEMMEKEKTRQWKGIELIASENFASQALLEALGSHLTNKYSEGLPGARYYGGNEHIDEIERLCCKRALDAFHLRPEEWGVNVQLYSCTSANFAVYTGLLQPKDRIMGLDTPSGGHLSHGYYTPSGKKISSASIFFENFPYKVDSKTGLIDYDGLEEKAKDYRPRILICGGSAYPREWKYERLREIADKCGAILMCDMAQISGLVAAEACDTPFKYCDIVTSTTHKSLRGPRGGMIFYRKGLKPRKKSSSQVSDEGGVYDFEDKINFAVFPSLQGGPHNNHIAALAVALKQVSSPEYKTYIQQVKSNAQALAAALQRKQCTLVTGGTDNHLLLWDLRPLGLTGSCYEKVCERCHITLNKNAVFGDSGGQGPGGVRIGTQAMTSRGCIESDFEMIANYLYRAVKITRAIQKEKENGTLKGFEKALLNNKEIAELRMEVEQFASSFDMPGFDVTSMR